MSWRIAARRRPSGTLLRQGGVVNDEDRIRSADQAIGLTEKRPLQRRPVPDPGRDEMVQPIVGDPTGSRRHRLDALAITQADETGHVARRAGCKSPDRNGCGHRSRSSRHSEAAGSAITHDHRHGTRILENRPRSHSLSK